jgi:hypothetical protein
MVSLQYCLQTLRMLHCLLMLANAGLQVPLTSSEGFNAIPSPVQIIKVAVQGRAQEQSEYDDASTNHR